MSDDYVRDLGDDLKEWMTHHVGPFTFTPLHALSTISSSLRNTTNFTRARIRTVTKRELRHGTFSLSVYSRSFSAGVLAGFL